MISDTAIIHPNVQFGQNVVVEDFCVIGAENSNCAGMATIVGNNAIIRSGTTIYAGNKIGDNFQTGNKANIRELNTIGDNVSIGTLSIIEHHVKIMDNVRIHSQVFVPEFSLLDTGCWLGPNVVITNARFPLHPNVKNELIGVHLEMGAKVGANSTLLPGITLGENCLIGAGSVVVKDVPAHKIFAGNPAKYIRDIDYSND